MGDNTISRHRFDFKSHQFYLNTWMFSFGLPITLILPRSPLGFFFFFGWGEGGMGVWILRLLYRNQPKACQENRNVQGNLGKFGKLRSAKLTLCCPQFSSVAQSCPTLCDPMNRSTPGLPVHHQLPEFTQTHVH